MGRDRSRRGARQRAGAARALSRRPRCCAVVKADGYGHGAVPVGRAALEAGRDRLGVALVEEGVELREAGIDAPILVLSEPVPEPRPRRRRAPAHAGRLHARRHRRAREGGRRPRRARPLARAPEGRHRDAPRRVRPRRRGRARGAGRRPARAAARRRVHALRRRRRARQPVHRRAARARSNAVLAALRARGLPTGIVHACNTAGAIDWPGARYDMVRVGIGIYGIAPRRRARRAASRCGPALSVKARVSHVKDAAARARGVSYGLRYETDARDAHRDRADRLRRRRAARAAAPRRRGADRRPAAPDRGHRHDGPAHGRRRRPRRSRSATRSC